MNLEVLHTKYEEIIIKIDHNSTYSKPSLFIRGGNSNYIRDKDIDDIHRLFPAAELVTLPKAGHWVHAEQPALFFDAVNSFISK
jgi:esterase